MPYTVTFEESGKEIEVRRTCNRCYGHAISVDDLAATGFYIVSRYGTAHDTRSGDAGRTNCGIDATGPTWWHRL